MVVALPFSLSATIIQHLPAYIYSFPYYFDQIKFNSQYVKWNDLEGHLVESKQCARLPPSFHARNRAENFVMCDLFRIYFSDFCVLVSANLFWHHHHQASHNEFTRTTQIIRQSLYLVSHHINLKDGNDLSTKNS